MTMESHKGQGSELRLLTVNENPNSQNYDAKFRLRLKPRITRVSNGQLATANEPGLRPEPQPAAIAVVTGVSLLNDHLAF